MKKTFLNQEKPLLTVMLQCETPEIAEGRIEKSLPLGADAFGLQVESLLPEYQTPETYRSLFEAMGDKPVYVTNYRKRANRDKDDETLAAELLDLAALGGTLCDVMGDYFDPQPGEITYDPEAVEKQKKLISDLHAKGAEVLMSCHVLKFISAEEVLKIALAQQERGADIVKIVTGAETEEQQVENLRICLLLKETLSVPFLFLSGGKSQLLRRIGPKLGCCMYLCVCEHDAHTTHAQPLLASVKALRDEMGL